jgi:hypothetical protein
MARSPHVDWRTILLVFVTCYAAPWVVVWSTLYLLFPAGVKADFSQIQLGALLVGAMVLLGPLAAGYFAARRARQRPRFTAMLTVLLGIAASVAAFDYGLEAHLIQAVLSLFMGALGALASTWRARREA